MLAFSSFPGSLYLCVAQLHRRYNSKAGGAKLFRAASSVCPLIAPLPPSLRSIRQAISELRTPFIRGLQCGLISHNRGSQKVKSIEARVLKTHNTMFKIFKAYRAHPGFLADSTADFPSSIYFARGRQGKFDIGARPPGGVLRGSSLEW